MSLLRALSTLAVAALCVANPISKRASNQAVEGPLAVPGIENYGGWLVPYTFFKGDGSTGAGWPAAKDWLSFNTMFTMNIPKIQQSCSIYSQPAPTTQEIRDLYTAIQQVAVDTKADHRFILAITMQESSGCPRAATSTSPSGVKNPGLMQDHNGTHSCNLDGKAQTSCPAGTIEAMIRDGTAGTDGGDGLAGIINQIGGDNSVQVYYEAARYYNAGVLDKSGDLGAPGATKCYASDIANRLIGWTTSPRTCDLDK